MVRIFLHSDRILARRIPNTDTFSAAYVIHLWKLYLCFLFTYLKDAYMVNPSRREKERKLIQIFIFALLFGASNYSMKVLMQVFGTHEAGRVK